MSKNKLESANIKMKKMGVRVTPHRAAILEYLLNSEDHPTADKIYMSIVNRFPSICLATVYNNLNILCENGLVRELPFGNTASRFDGNTTEHYHIVCNSCDEVIDFHYPLLKKIEVFAEQTTDFKVTHHRFEIYGNCVTCCG